MTTRREFLTHAALGVGATLAGFMGPSASASDARFSVSDGKFVLDGKPFQVVDYPYTARWPLAPGEHRFQVRLPHTEIVSNQVTVWIQ